MLSRILSLVLAIDQLESGMHRVKIFNIALMLAFLWSCKPNAKPSQAPVDKASSSDKDDIVDDDALEKKSTANRGTCKLLTASEAKSLYSTIDDKRQPTVQEEDGLVACSFSPPKITDGVLNVQLYTDNAVSRAQNDWDALKKFEKCPGENVTSDHQNVSAQYAEICIGNDPYYFLKGNDFVLQFMPVFSTEKGKDKAGHRATFKRLVELVNAHRQANP